MIGNFVEDRDQLTLAKPTRLLLDESRNIRTVFIGGPGTTINQSMEVFSSDEINQKVFFTGPIANASELIPIFNLMVFSSKSETFGMAAIESLIYKIPVVASDIPVMVELSMNGKYFDLFKTGDPIELAHIIKNHMDNLNNKLDIESSRDYALKEFSSSRYIQKLADVYES